VGVMIEVPSAVWLTGALANRVDFLSVGSNDLTQYLLAVDRNNARVAELYHGLHPAVLGALQQIVDAAHLEGCSVSICGEMAGDPRAVPLLLAMGFDQLSMSAINLPRVKKVINSLTMADANELLAELIGVHSSHAVIRLAENLIERKGLDRYVRLNRDNR